MPPAGADWPAVVPLESRSVVDTITVVYTSLVHENREATCEIEHAYCRWILLAACDDEARAPYLLGGLGVVQGACLRLGYRARLDRSAVLTALVKSLAFDLRRDELMMTLRPIPKKAMIEIVEDTVVSVVTKDSAESTPASVRGLLASFASIAVKWVPAIRHCCAGL